MKISGIFEEKREKEQIRKAAIRSPREVEGER